MDRAPSSGIAPVRVWRASGGPPCCFILCESGASQSQGRLRPASGSEPARLCHCRCATYIWLFLNAPPSRDRKAVGGWTWLTGESSIAYSSTRCCESVCYVVCLKLLKDPLRLDSLVGNLASSGLPVSLPLPLLRDTASGLVQPVDVLRTMLDFDTREELRNGATITLHFPEADRVIPIGQGCVSAEVTLAHLRVRDGLALFIMFAC